MVREVGPGGLEAGGKVVEVRVWQDLCDAVDQGDSVAAWLCAFLELVSGRFLLAVLGAGMLACGCLSQFDSTMWFPVCMVCVDEMASGHRPQNT